MWEMSSKPQLIGIAKDGKPVLWVPPIGMDPAVSYESLLVGAAVYACSGDGLKAEAAALAHYYNAGFVDINAFIK
jgi:hypothetical protein